MSAHTFFFLHNGLTNTNSSESSCVVAYLPTASAWPRLVGDVRPQVPASLERTAGKPEIMRVSIRFLPSARSTRSRFSAFYFGDKLRGSRAMLSTFILCIMSEHLHLRPQFLQSLRPASP